MPLEDWISCPGECDANVEAVTFRDGRIGLSCVGCGRKIEVPVETVEAGYRTVEQ